jgi:hypothetical protein
MKSIYLVFFLAGRAFAESNEANSRENEMFGNTIISPSEKLIEKNTEKIEIEKVNIGGRLDGTASFAPRANSKGSQEKIDYSLKSDVFIEAVQDENLRALARLRFLAKPASSQNTQNSQNTQGFQLSQNTTTETFSTQLDEAWVKYNSNKKVFYTLGKQHIKFGSGRFWNPTDFLAPEIKDPFASFDSRLGVWLVKVNVPIEEFGTNILGILNFSNANTPENLSGTFRIEQAVAGMAEVSLTAQAAPKNNQKFGLDISAGLGIFDVYLENAWTKTNGRTKLKGGSFTEQNFSLPTLENNSSKFIPQTSVGAAYTFNYSDSDSATLGVEYLENSLGYEEKDLVLYSLVTAQNQSLYHSKRYLGAFFRLPNPGSLNSASFLLNSISSLVDKSTALRGQASYELGTRTFLELNLGTCFGKGGELCFALPKTFKSSLSGFLDLIPQTSTELQGLKNSVAQIPNEPSRFNASIGVNTTF